MSPAIAIEGLRVRFGARPILRDLTVRLDGRSVGLLGPNGAGKTTLIHTLLGFHRPSSGTARVLGHDVATPAGRAAVRHVTGYMPERDAFIGDVSAVRQVRLFAELSGLPPAAALERAHEALIAVGLGEARYRPVGTYSLGMKQRVKLAQAVVHGPKLLFLDEPTNGLDPAGRARMLALIRDIRASGVAVLMSSHLLHDVEEVCDEVIVLKDGRLALHADVAAERRTDRRLLDVEVRGDRDALAGALAGIGCEVARHGAWRLKVVLAESVTVRDVYRLASAGSVSVRRLAYRRRALADLFLAAMGAPLEGGTGPVEGGGTAPSEGGEQPAAVGSAPEGSDASPVAEVEHA